jgi:3-phosphoshikimate 1-carboxyvinyltransferase
MVLPMHDSSAPQPLQAAKSGPLTGTVLAPGDKSISHRALILGAMTVGETRIEGLLEAEDVVNTAGAMRSLGASLERLGTGAWRVQGVGVGGFSQPDGPLDFGNSGTGCRLSMGAVATTPIAATFTGDASLCRRPMKRVLEPLAAFGLGWSGNDKGLLPMTLTGAADPLPIRYILKVPSAQVKSALLLAALNVPGTSTIIEPIATRDHTERMLRAFGAAISLEETAEGMAISITGETDLKPAAIAVPADPSSAAFPLVAALITPGSDILLERVMLNPSRTGILQTLKEMGGDITIENERDIGGEIVGDIRVRHSALKGVDVPPERAPSMIDEFPVLSIAAAFAEGPTTMRGLEELRVKESDRLSAVAAGLKSCGVAVTESPDGLVVEGCGPEGVKGGGHVLTHMDHRIAMSFLVMGGASREPVHVDDSAMIATSFPNFESLMAGLGALIQRPNS